ncbi:MAG: phosphotransferase [Anaerolineae bacterium]|nr:phosphotransferase [Anaerolineae bacterium]
MATIGLKDILAISEQESAHHHHYYIGVEHLFIALTKLQNGLTNAILEYTGLEPRFVRYSIRQTIGMNENRRFWPGFRETPRTSRVLKMAQKYAGLHTPSERDLLLAILDEADSVAVRVLQEVGADIPKLRQIAANWSTKARADVPDVPIDGYVDLNADERRVLQRMFRTHQRIVVERELAGSYGNTRLLVVQPMRPQRAEARVVVKIDERSAILYEKRHYDSYVKDTLPPTTARVLDNPSLPEDSPLGGLKYTLVQPLGSTNPIDLRAFADHATPEDIGRLIQHSVYQSYAGAWWSQRQRYRFGVWREYEHVLPAALEIAVMRPSTQTSYTEISPLGAWSRSEDIEIGQLVDLRDFTVQKVRPDKGTVQLSAGSGPEAVNRASKVEVIGLGDEVKEFRRGELVPRLTGRVIRRRKEILLEQAQWLEPLFDLTEQNLPAPAPLNSLPNPLLHVNNFLERRVSGYLSIIHGDLHLGNILVGPAGDAWLVDFALTREGHTLFDWAVLEVSLLCTVVGPRMPEGWDGVWGTIRLLEAVNSHNADLVPQGDPVAQALSPIITLRKVVEVNLARTQQWREYHVALMLVALRGLSWKNSASLDVRRLLFLTAALSVDYVLKAEKGVFSTQGMSELPTDGTGTRMPFDPMGGDTPMYERDSPEN